MTNSSPVLCVRVPEETLIYVRSRGGASYVRSRLEPPKIRKILLSEVPEDKPDDKTGDDDDEPTVPFDLESIPPEEDRAVGEGLLF